MKPFPQLRVRTGYSTRSVYGRIPEVFERLKELETPIAGIVDSNTYGHVRWEKQATKDGIQALFGMEVVIALPEDDSKLAPRPRAWILSRNTRQFYGSTSKAVQSHGLTPDEFGALQGVVRFAGAAVHLLEPDQYDYIDINCTQLLLAAMSLKIARETGKPMVITGFNEMPAEKHRNFAYSWEVKEYVAPQTIEGVEFIWEHLYGLMSRDEFDEAVANTVALAEELAGQRLQTAPIIHLEGDMVALAREGQQYRLAAGHIAEWTQEYEDRFNEEIHQIQLKEFDSYFLVVADLVRFAKTKMLVGPARGSSAGSLVCFCLGITEVDPLPHKLLFQRFIDISRADLPDIDIDFADNKRYMVFDYLREKYGIENVSKMGNINTLKAASVMAQVGKKFLIESAATSQVRNALIEYSSGDARYGKGLQDTFEMTAPGQDFRSDFPDAAACMSDLELHPSHYGVHAAAILVCNDPITDYCTVNADGVAQIDKPDSEYLNLLKIDALGLRTLGIIDDTGVVTAEELYGLKLNDPNVFEVLDQDRVSGIFQFEGQAVRSVAKFIDMDRFSRIDNVTALARPGPLASGMAQKYIARAAGKEPVEYEAPQLEPYLRETMGVFLYQEQIMSVVRDIGQFDWVRTSAIRKAMSGRKGEEYFNQQGADFIAGAITTGMDEEKAKQIWNEMVTFGSWGFNKSHSVSYAIITYWTLWLKAYHKLEFAAACLRAAKDDEQTIAILRELDAEGITYKPMDAELSQANWAVADGKLLGGIRNAKGYGAVKAAQYIAYRDAGLLTQAQKNRLMCSEIKFADLREMHTKFGHFYDNPRLANVLSGEKIVNMAEVKDRDEALIIGKMVKKVLADENEAIRIKKRGGKRMSGQTQFVDLMLVDDSTDNPMRFRIRPNNFLAFGKQIAESAAKGAYFLVRAWKISGIDMFIIKKIKEVFPPEPQAEAEEESDESEEVMEEQVGEEGN